MLIALSAILASAGLLPEIDTATLERQAAKERSRPVAAAPRSPTVRAPARVPARRTATLVVSDVDTMVTICRAAGSQARPMEFIGALADAYAMTADERMSLVTGCAGYLAGRSEAGRPVVRRLSN